MDWSLSGSFVNRYEPDRSDIAYIADIDPVTGVSTPVALARRSALRDPHLQRSGRATPTRGWATIGSSWGPAPHPVTVKVGGAYRAVDRVADSRAFDITNRGLVRRRTGSSPPEQIFAGPFAEDGRLSLFINANGGRYDAEDRLAAGYAQVELPITGRLRLIGGARLEHWDLDLNTLDPQGVRPRHGHRATTPTCCPRSR